MNYRKLPDTTEKQKEIVDLAFKFRFINRQQILKLFGHKDPGRINKWLKDLVEKKYLGRIYSHKLLENTKPAIYYLSNNGILWVRFEKGMEYDDKPLEFKYVKKFYEDKHASKSFINHCVSLFEFYIQYKEKEKANKKIEYEISTKTEMWIRNQLYLYPDEDFGDVKDILPDLYIHKWVDPKGKNPDSFTSFLTLFDSHVPRYAMRYKVDQYIKFHEEGEWKKYSGDNRKFPIILFIFPTAQKANQIGKYVKRQIEEQYVEGMTFMTTTYEKAMTVGIGGAEKTWEIL